MHLKVDLSFYHGFGFGFFYNLVLVVVFGNIDSAYGPAAKTYINWAATMALSLDTGVPWVMCSKQMLLIPL